jgi:hypothetical protein
MLTQEAAVTLAQGGSVQVYENPGRDPRRAAGALAPEAAGGSGAVRKNGGLCARVRKAYPLVAVLHSEAHVRGTARGLSLFWGMDVVPGQAVRKIMVAE